MAVPACHRSDLWRGVRLRLLQALPASGPPADAPGALRDPESLRLRLLGDAPGQSSFHQHAPARPPAFAIRTSRAVRAPESLRLRLLGGAPGQSSFHQHAPARPPAFAIRTSRAVRAPESLRLRLLG